MTEFKKFESLKINPLLTFANVEIKDEVFYLRSDYLEMLQKSSVLRNNGEHELIFYRVVGSSAICGASMAT